MIAEARSIGFVALIAVVLALALLGLPPWFRRRGDGGRNDRTVFSKLGERLESWGQFAVAAIRGDHGRKTQVLAIAALVGAAVLLGFPIALPAACIALVIFWLSMKNRAPESTGGPWPPPPSPPPPPPPAARPSTPQQAWERGESDLGGRRNGGRRRPRFGTAVVLAALLVGVFGAGVIGYKSASKRVSRAADRAKMEVRRELAKNAKLRAEVEKWIDDPELRRQILPPPVLAAQAQLESEPRPKDSPAPPHAPVADRQPEASEEDVGQRLRDKVKDAVVQEAVDVARRAYARLLDSAGSNQQGQAEAKDAPIVDYLPDGEFEVPQPPARVAFTTVECGTQQEADHRLVKQVSRFLTLALAKSGKPFDAGSWQPSLDWTARNFAADRTIHTRQNQQTGATLFTGEVVVDAPDEKKIEKIWKHYLDEQASSRSRSLLKAYAGAVFVLGGLAVLLRLGTGRRIQPDQVSYKQRKQSWTLASAALLGMCALLALPLFVGWLLFG
jgi:hypothetical protein